MPSASWLGIRGSTNSCFFGSLFIWSSFRFAGAVLQRKGAHAVAKPFALHEGVNGRADEHGEEQADGDNSESGDAAQVANDVLDHSQFLDVSMLAPTCAVVSVGGALVSEDARSIT